MQTHSEKSGDIVVVGDGIVARTVARRLVTEGFRVDIVTATKPSASLAAAGMLSPLAESATGSPFQMACLSARDLWLTWSELLRQETGIDLGWCGQPVLFPAYSNDDQAFIDDLQQRAEIAGEGVEALLPEAVYRFAPTLARGVTGGLLLADEPRVDPVAVMAALDSSLGVQGVITHHNRSVQEVRLEPDTVELIGEDWHLHCDHAIFAAGAWSSQIAGLGMESLVRPVRGQMIAYQAEAGWKGCIRHGSYYALTRGDEILFGATQEDVGYEDVTTKSAASELRDAAERLVPSLAWRKASRHWSGLRPGTVDDLPIIGPWLSNRVTVATGTFRNGILLAPWIAEIVADLVQSGESETLPAAFSASRFA